MTSAERELFKKERVRLGLNQEQAAAAGGISQGTISKIEIEPDYDPSISAFRNALKGVGLTLSTFFTQIEGLPMPEVRTQDRPATIPPIGFDDEALSTLPPKELIRVIVALAHAYAAREREASSREHRGHPAETRVGQTGADHRARSHRQRNRKRRVKRLPPKG